MSAITASLLSLPWAQYRRHPTFYLWYDAFYAAVCLAAIFAMVETGYVGPLATFQWWHLALLPPVAYLSIMAHVFIHNASHGNFPKAINRVVGELCGIVVISRFASWEIVHRRHHRHTDDPEKDPHPAERSYWRYVVTTLVNVEKQLQQQYFEVYGDTPQTRRYERWRARWSFTSGTLLFVTWFMLIGASGFFTVFLPCFIGAALFVIHFNWAGHNAHTKDKPIAPANLDHGWFWLGNRIFFGIYYHGNHHKMAMLFNPMKMPKKRPREDETEGLKAAA